MSAQMPAQMPAQFSAQTPTQMPAQTPAQTSWMSTWMPTRAWTFYICKNLNSNQQWRRSINETEWKTLWQQHYNHSDWNQKQLQAWFLEVYQQSIS